MVGILCALLSGGGNRFHVLQRSWRKCCSPVGRSYAVLVPLQLQTAPRNHSRLPAARLHGGTQRFFARSRATRIETAGRSRSIAAGVHSKRRTTSFAQVSRSTAEGFPVRD